MRKKHGSWLPLAQLFAGGLVLTLSSNAEAADTFTLLVNNSKGPTLGFDTDELQAIGRPPLAVFGFGPILLGQHVDFVTNDASLWEWFYSANNWYAIAGDDAKHPPRLDGVAVANDTGSIVGFTGTGQVWQGTLVSHGLSQRGAGR